MARKTSNVADLDIGANAVQHITSIIYEVPDRPVIASDALTDGEVEVLDVGAVGGPRTMEVAVELDSADTNGQGALQTAFEDGSVVASVVFYPDGKVGGAEQYSGSVYVTGAPRLGSAGNENKARKGTYKLTWAAKPAKGTVV